MKYEVQVTGITHSWVTWEVHDYKTAALKQVETAIRKGRKATSIRIVPIPDDPPCSMGGE